MTAPSRPVIRVYPRVYGGTRNSWRPLPGSHGLSPRVRGNRAHRSGCHSVTGSIPACTGEPAFQSARQCPRRVYPRVYGGTSQRQPAHGTEDGLSPRVRGNLGSHRFWVGSLGSIPACTGEPRWSDTASSARRVYPRVYGGTAVVGHSLISQAGLSPRVRGNRGRINRRHYALGSIPACTGEPRCG